MTKNGSKNPVFGSKTGVLGSKTGVSECTEGTEYSKLFLFRMHEIIASKSNFYFRKKLILTQIPTQMFEFKFGMQGLRKNPLCEKRRGERGQGTLNRGSIA